MTDNLIDAEAIDKALWLRDYCKMHTSESCNIKCIFLNKGNSEEHDKTMCILRTPAFWSSQNILKDQPKNGI